jgi:hypothetical protein
VKDNVFARDRALWAVVASAVGYAVLCLALTRRGAPLPPDAVEYAAVARNLTTGRGFTIDFIEFHPGFLSSIRHPLELHGVLTPFLLAPLFHVWGPNEALVRVPGVLFCAGIIVATFALARHVFGTRAGLLAAFAFLLRGDFIGVAVLGGDDVGWALFSTLAVLSFLHAAERGSLRAFGAAGALAAAATLQKYTGVLLGIALCSALLVRRSTVRERVRECSAVAGPVLIAVAVYWWKNYVTHGRLGFRFAALDWLSREDLSAYFAYYETPPRLSEVWARMGFGKAAKLCAVQAAALGRLMLANRVTALGGIAALVWAARSKPPFGRVGLLYGTALAAVVILLYHVEPRYLFGLVPIFYVAMAGLGVEVFDWVSRRLPARAAPYVRAAVFAVGAVLLVRTTVELVRNSRLLSAVMAKKGTCDDAFAFVRASVPLDDPILSSSPWYVTWMTERPSVAAPSNGVRALSKVVKHYGVRWAVTGLSTFGGGNVEADLRGLRESGGKPSYSLSFDGANCDVYRLEQ